VRIHQFHLHFSYGVLLHRWSLTEDLSLVRYGVPCVWDFYSKLSTSARNNRFWPLLILKNRVLSSFIPFPTFIRHGCCREYYPVGLWFAQVSQSDKTVGKQIQQCNYSQVKIQFNLKKLLQKVSQLILVGFSVLFNILKVYQSRNPGKVFFSRWRPRWPPKRLSDHNILCNYQLKFDDLGVYLSVLGGKEHIKIIKKWCWPIM